MPCCAMVPWKELSICRTEVMVWASAPGGALAERCLKPGGFMLKTPCRLSCSSMPGTAHRDTERNVRGQDMEGFQPDTALGLPRIARPTAHWSGSLEVCRYLIDKALLLSHYMKHCLTSFNLPQFQSDLQGDTAGAL